ncbi:MAG: hypothetical protein M3Y72_07235, partial [Acidobacteriota bacterium]|nr:hypothetical protein [Acidobacteriota bacterium]
MSLPLLTQEIPFDCSPRPSARAKAAGLAVARLKDLLFLVAFTFAALLIHGYHPAAEDAAIYLPAIKKDLNGHLYPFGSEFFMSHARLTWFDELIADSVKLTHVHLDSMLLFWHLLSVFLLLLACLLLSEAVFGKGSQRWSAVAIITAVLTIPVAGTSLLLMDPYLTPRSLSTPLVLFALTAMLKRRYLLTGLCLLAIAPIHPLMTIYGAALCVTLLLLRLNAFVRTWGWLTRNASLQTGDSGFRTGRAWASATVLPVTV